MDPTTLIPTPDTIPAPAWLFELLDLVTFTLHILIINVALGGSLIALFARLKRRDLPVETSLSGSVVSKLPMTFALGINLGVAPLLFIQVIYGNLIYSSSVLMAVYWILVIPFLILAYYGAYIHTRKYTSRPSLSIFAIALSSVLLLYIAFVYVNNMTLMVQPEKWIGYFQNRGGTLLNLGDATLWPRYLHFVTASVAVAGLFMALIWRIRQKQNKPDAAQRVKTGLQIFAIATSVQVIIGFWFLLAIPRDFILSFMGQNLVYTIILFTGMALAIAAIMTAFLNKLIPSVILLLGTIIMMVITRANLRALYLEKFFSFDSLQLVPQYGVMILFFIIFVTGLAIVGYLLKIAYQANERRAV